MGDDREGSYDSNSYGSMRADMLGGIDPHDNVLRDAMGEGLGTSSRIGEEAAKVYAGGMICKIAAGSAGLAFSAGSRSMIWSGDGAAPIAKLLFPDRVLVSETLGGKALSAVDPLLRAFLPRRWVYEIWRGASWLYASGATGTVPAVIVGNPAGYKIIWTEIRVILGGGGTIVVY